MNELKQFDRDMLKTMRCYQRACSAARRFLIDVTFSTPHMAKSRKDLQQALHVVYSRGKPTTIRSRKQEPKK